MKTVSKPLESHIEKLWAQFDGSDRSYDAFVEAIEAAYRIAIRQRGKQRIED